MSSSFEHLLRHLLLLSIWPKALPSLRFTCGWRMRMVCELAEMTGSIHRKVIQRMHFPRGETDQVRMLGEEHLAACLWTLPQNLAGFTVSFNFWFLCLDSL